MLRSPFICVKMTIAVKKSFLMRRFLLILGGLLCEFCRLSGIVFIRKRSRGRLLSRYFAFYKITASPRFFVEGGGERGMGGTNYYILYIIFYFTFYNMNNHL
jgi:hypothetical protein